MWWKQGSSVSRQLGIILALAVALRLSAVMFFGALQDIDNYENIARSLLEGKGYRAGEDLEPNVQRPPAYPLMLFFIYSALGPSGRNALVCQALLSSLTILLIFSAARRVFDQRVALAGAALFAVYPFSVWYAAHLLSETLFTFLLAASVLYWVRLYQNGTLGDALGAGFWIGLGSLCKGTMLLLPIAVGASLLLAHRSQLRQRAFHFLIVSVTTAAVVLPWTLRNISVAGGALIPVSIGAGHAFYEGNVLGLKPGPEGNIFRREVSPERERERMRLFRELSRMGGRRAVEEDRRLLEQGIVWVREHPDLFLIGVLKKAVAYWYVNSWPTETKTALIVCLQTPLLACAAIGCWKRRRELRARAPLLFVIGYFWAVHSVLIVWLRLSFPVMPYVLLLAAEGLQRASSRPGSGEPRDECRRRQAHGDTGL